MENNLTILTGDLTPMQKKFCERYAVHLKLSLACEEAGYTGNSLGAQANALMKLPKIQAYIEHIKSQQMAAFGLTPERVLKELARLAFVDPSKMYDDEGCMLNIKDMDEDTRRAISSVETKELFEQEGRKKKYVGDAKKAKLGDKTKALELLMRHFGQFNLDNQQSAANVVVVTSDEAKTIMGKLDENY